MKVVLSSLILILLICVVVEVQCEWREYHEPRLVKVEIVDERGQVRAKMMEQRQSKDPDSNDGGGVDDEDSPSNNNEGSGFSNDQLLSDVAHDPIASQNDSKVSVTTISPSPPSTVTTSNSFNTVSMTQNQVYSSTSIVTSTKSLKSTVSVVNPTPALTSTTSSKTTISSSSVVTSTQPITSGIIPSKTADVSSTVVVVPEVTTTSTTTTTTQAHTTTQRPTTIELATQPNINKPTTTSATVIAKNDTKKPENETVFSITTTPRTNTLFPTSKSTLFVAVKAHVDPTEKPKKTLFGFVTIEILIALLAGALFSILLVAFLVYRLKKRNEGSYELSETIALRPKELDEMSSKKEVFV